MARRTRPERLEEYDLLGFELIVVCKGCKREVSVPPALLATILKAKGWPTDRMLGGQHLRCENCGTKWPALGARELPLPGDPE